MLSEAIASGGYSRALKRGQRINVLTYQLLTFQRNTDCLSRTLPSAVGYQPSSISHRSPAQLEYNAVARRIIATTNVFPSHRYKVIFFDSRNRYMLCSEAPSDLSFAILLDYRHAHMQDTSPRVHLKQTAWCMIQSNGSYLAPRHERIFSVFSPRTT